MICYLYLVGKAWRCKTWKEAMLNQTQEVRGVYKRGGEKWWAWVNEGAQESRPEFFRPSIIQQECWLTVEMTVLRGFPFRVINIIKEQQVTLLVAHSFN